MSETVKEIEITSSFNEDNWYSECIGQKFTVIDAAWWSFPDCWGDCYYVDHPKNDEDTVFYVLKSDCKVTESIAQSAPDSTASPSETAADKGILTEEELNSYEAYVPTAVINSHRALFKEFDMYKTIALEFVTEQTARKIYALLRSGQ